MDHLDCVFADRRALGDQRSGLASALDRVLRA